MQKCYKCVRKENLQINEAYTLSLLDIYQKKAYQEENGKASSFL